MPPAISNYQGSSKTSQHAGKYVHMLLHTRPAILETAARQELPFRVLMGIVSMNSIYS